MMRLRGQNLELYAQSYGLTRNGPSHWYWPFKECDRSLRRRLIAMIRSCYHCSL